MKNKLYLLLILLACAGTAAAARAADDSAGADEEAGFNLDTVIVPYDLTKPIDSQKPDRVYIRYERFVQLWEAAKANRRGIPPEAMAQSYVLSSARYDAKLDDGALHVTGVIDFQTFNEGWVTVPLNFNGVKLGVLKLDGQTASLADGGMAVEKPGRHRIEAEFDIPLGSDKTHMTFGIPKTAGTLFSITLPDKQMKAGVQPGDGVVERIEGDQKIVTAALGSTDHVDLTLDSSVGLSKSTQAAVAKIDTTLNITPAVELIHSGFEYSFPESQQDHFTVLLDKALALVKLDVPNLKSWKLTVGADNQTLEITIAEPARGSFKFSIDAERSLTERQRHFPYISAAANRIEQTSALFSTPLLDVTPQPTDALRQISYSGNQNAGLALVAAFASTGDKELLAYEVAPAKLSNKAEISYVYLVNHSKIELVAALKLRVKDATLFNVTLGLPGDFTVEAVESARLKDWWLEGGMLHVRFKGNAPGAETPLVLHLVKLYKATPDKPTPDALEIKPLTLPDTWDVEGNGIIAASTSVQAEMTLAGAKEINPQNAATDFRILPPMERKRGFSFKGQDFHASVTLETLPPRVDGTWVMSAQAHESWVSVSTHVNLSARQGTASGVSFRLPASVPEARVTGDNVRETTSAVDGKWRVYQVAFQNDLSDKTDFTVDFELPGDGNVSLPSFEFLDVDGTKLDRSEGFVIVDNASEYVMQVKPDGLDVALNEQIPYLPTVSRNASLYRALPGWTLQINLTRLEKEAGRSVLVEYADMKTAIRPDGSEWHSATYQLLNSSLQFFPVKLPEGSELASVSVAGENVRADRGTVDGKDVLLIPLIKAKSGDLPYNVSLVYRKKGKSPWTISHETLADPEVVGITVERTFWSLYLPEGTDAGHFGGNMEQVLNEVNQTEKSEAMLDEANRLKSDWLNGDRNAGENYKRVIKSLEVQTQATGQPRENAYLGAKTTINSLSFQKQSAAVAMKNQEIQKKADDMEKEYEGDEARAEAANPAAAQPPAAAGKPQAGFQDQSWASNGSFTSTVGAVTADKSKEIDRQNPQGNQLYVNDNVVHLEGSNTFTNGLALTGSDNYTGAINGAGANSDSINTNIVTGGNQTWTLNSAASSGMAVQNQVSQVQGQQVLQRQAEALAKNESVTAMNAGALTITASGSNSGGASAANMGTMNTLSGTLANINGGVITQFNPNENVRVLGAARANADTNAMLSGSVSQAQQELAAAQMESDAALKQIPQSEGAPGALGNYGRGGMEGKGAGQGAGQGEEDLPAGRRDLQKEGSGLGYFGGGGYTTEGGGGAGGAAAPAQLQAPGAISLPVDFPVDGLHVYYFNKVKANATLSFWITNEQRLDKWKWLVLFLVVAGVIKGVCIVIDRGYVRVLRRRIVHI